MAFANRSGQRSFQTDLIFGDGIDRFLRYTESTVWLAFRRHVDHIPVDRHVGRSEDFLYGCTNLRTNTIPRYQRDRTFGGRRVVSQATHQTIGFLASNWWDYWFKVSVHFEGLASVRAPSAQNAFKRWTNRIRTWRVWGWFGFCSGVSQVSWRWSGECVWTRSISKLEELHAEGDDEPVHWWMWSTH